MGITLLLAATQPLNADMAVSLPGSLDGEFNATVADTFPPPSGEPQVHAATALAGSGLLFGPGQTYLERLNPDGTADLAFRQNTSGRAAKLGTLTYQPGNDEFRPAAPVARTLTVAGMPQEIDFPEVGDIVYSDEPYPLNVTADSGLPVHLETSDAEVAGVLNGNLIVHRAGTVTITASQEGNVSYLPAEPVSREILIQRAPQTIEFPPLAPVVLSAGHAALEATAGSGLPVSFSTDAPDIGTISGTRVILQDRGTALITASQAGDERYLPAEPVGRELRVLAPDPSFPSQPPAWGQEGRLFSLTVTAGTEAVQFTATALPPGLTINSATGKISGRPTMPGTFEIILGAGNEDGVFSFSHVRVTIFPITGPLPEVTSPTWLAVNAGDAISLTLSAQNLDSTTAFHVSELPTGLHWDVAARRLHGTLPPGLHEAKMSVSNIHGETGKMIRFTIHEPKFAIEQLGGTGTFLAAAAGNGRRIAAGANGLIAAADANQQWEFVEPPVVTSFRGAAFGAGRFILVGDGGVILNSVNGRDWEQAPSPTTGDLQAVRHLNGQFIAVGDEGSVLVSINGIDWDPVAKLAVGSLRDVAYGNNRYMIVAGGGTAFFSLDGEHWEMAPVRFDRSFRSVAFGNGRFIGLAQSGGLAYTEDGVDWGFVRENTPVRTDIRFRRGEFLVAGPSGLFASTDGHRWRLIESTPVTALSREDDFFAVGASTRIASPTETSLGLPVLTGPTYVAKRAGEALRYRLTTQGGPADILVGSLPPGLQFDAEAGEITGTVLAPGSHLLRVAAFNETGIAQPVDILLEFFPESGEPPRFEGRQTYGAIMGAPISTIGVNATIHHLDRTSRLRIEGAPPGATVQLHRAVPWGTPLEAGVFQINVAATNFHGASETEIRLVVSQAGNWVAEESGTTETLTAVAFAQDRFVSVGENGGLYLSTAKGEWSQVRDGDGVPLRAIAGSDLLWVAVGDDGRILSSPTGDTWEAQASPVESRLSAVAHGTGWFVAVGDGGVILRSADGASWTGVESGTAQDLRAVTFTGEEFVAVGNAGTILHSNDGAEWFAGISPTTAGLRAVAFANGRYFVASDLGSSHVSEDGATWTNTLGGVQVRAFAAHPAGILAFNGNARSSSDGVYWAPWSMTTGASTWQGATFGGGRFVAVGGNGSIRTHEGTFPPRIATSPERGIEGRSYTSQFRADEGPEEFFANGLPPGLTLDPATGIVSGVPTQMGTFEVESFARNSVGHGPVSRTTMTIHQADGWPPTINKTPIELEVGKSAFESVQFHSFPFLLHTVEITGDVPGLTFAGNTIRGVPEATGIFPLEVRAENPYGVSETTVWVSVYKPLWAYEFSSPPFSDIASNGTIVVAAGPGGIISTTSNLGESWNRPFTGTLRDLLGVAHGNERFVVVGASGHIRYSENGTNWIQATSETTETLHGIARGGGVFVAVGDNGTILASADGISWQARPSGSPANLRAVTFGGGRFAAVGDEGVILHSVDGEIWEHVAGGVGSPLHGVAWQGGVYIAGGDDGVLLRSPDVVNWSPVEAPGLDGLDISRVLSGRDEWAILASDGHVHTSHDGLVWLNRTHGDDHHLASLAYAEGRYFSHAAQRLLTSAGEWTPIMPPLALSRVDAVRGEQIFVQLSRNDAGDPFIGFLPEYLPETLTIDPDTGIISGQLIESGTAHVGLINEHSPSRLRWLSFQAFAPGGSPPYLPGPLIAIGRLNESFVHYLSRELTNFGGTVSANGLPAGVDVTSPGGIPRITGTPSESGTFEALIRTANVYGETQADFVMHVPKVKPGSPRLTMAHSMRGAVSIPFDHTPGINFDIGKVTAFNLPPGLQVDPSTGRIHGTPSQTGEYNVLLVVENDFGSDAATALFQIEHLPPKILPEGEAFIARTGEEVLLAPVVWGSDLEYWWTLDENPIHESTGVSGALSETLRIFNPNPASSGSYHLHAANSQGEIRSAPFDLTITETYDQWAARILGGGNYGKTDDDFLAGIPNIVVYALGLTHLSDGNLPRLRRGTEGLLLEYVASRTTENLTIRIEESGDLIHWSPFEQELHSILETPTARILEYLLSDDADTLHLRLQISENSNP